MKVTLTKDILVQPHDVQPTAAGTVVDIDDALAKELISNGYAAEGGAKKAAAPPENKMAAAPANKAGKA